MGLLISKEKLKTQHITSSALSCVVLSAVRLISYIISAALDLRSSSRMVLALKLVREIHGQI